VSAPEPRSRSSSAAPQGTIPQRFKQPVPAALTQPEVFQLVCHPRQPHRAQDVVQAPPLVLAAQRPQLRPRLEGWVGREAWVGGCGGDGAWVWQ
jgi:hypothetical protein